MGACFGRCCPIGRLRRKICRKRQTDQENFVEFESLMDISPSHDEPLSISSMLAFRRKKHSKHEEEMELEEEAFLDVRREATRIARLANSQQIINPARLVFRDSTSSWATDNETNSNGNGLDDDLDVFIDENKLRALTSRTYLPSHSSFLDTGSTVSSVNGKDNWVHTNGSTPASSLDLEWDEAGIFIPNESNKNSTPASNDLEWDNDFESTHLDEIDMETEQLISEIEKLTTSAQQETNRGYR